MVTIVVQLGYAAITSRLLSPHDFGIYAVALAVAGFIGLLANGGLAQTIARVHDLDRNLVRGLVTYSLVLGFVAAGVVFFTADIWAWVWGVPSAAEPIRWMSLAAVSAPLFSLATGYLRRVGRFRVLALAVVFCNLAGMALGAVGVAYFLTPSSLLISAIAGQTFTVVTCVVLSGRPMRGLGRLSYARAEIGFSWRLTLTSIVSYLNGNVMRWGVSRFIGSSALGVWNRADVLTTVPFTQLQSAMLQVLYPEFRHQIDAPERAKRVWTDLLTMIAWALFPLAAIVAVLMPVIVPVMFGPGWRDVVPFLVALAFAGAMQVVSTALAVAVEAMARFRWIWLTQLSLLALQLAAIIMLLLTREIAVALIALVLTHVIRHVIHLILCHRTGYVDAPALLSSYFGVGIVSLGIYVALRLVVEAVSLAIDGSPIWGGVALLSLAALAWGTFRARNRYPLLILAKEYKLLP